jgi:hypothetical protein
VSSLSHHINTLPYEGRPDSSGVYLSVDCALWASPAGSVTNHVTTKQVLKRKTFPARRLHKKTLKENDEMFMRTNLSIPQGKSKIWASQKERVYKSLLERPQTRLQVASNTNTPIQNVTRYVADFRKASTLAVLRVDTCPISKMKAEIISTNPVYLQSQLTMFQ